MMLGQNDDRLSAAGQIHLLREFYHEVVVPSGVRQELMAAAASLPGAKETMQASEQGWLKVQTPGNSHPPPGDGAPFSCSPHFCTVVQEASSTRTTIALNVDYV